MKYLLPLVIGLLVAGASIGQDRKITGRILDALTEKPLKGANIVIRQTIKGTTSNYLGFFELMISDGIEMQIVISYVGYETATVDVPKTSGVKILLNRRREYLEPIYTDAHPKKPFDVGAFRKVGFANGQMVVVESNAEYKGGHDNFSAYISTAIYQETRNRRNPKTSMNFTIDKNGRATDLQFQDPTNSINPILVKIFNEMPGWIPATQGGDSVSQFFTLRILNRDSIDAANRQIIDFIGSNIQYPPEALGAGITGHTWTQFIVKENVVIEATTLRNIADISEMTRVIKLLTPALLKQLTTATTADNFIIPIIFGEATPLTVYAGFSEAGIYTMPPVIVRAKKKK